MLLFSADQTSLLDWQQANRFPFTLDAFLREQGLIDDADPDDPLGITDRLIARAQQIGLTSELSIARYAILATQFGESLEALSDRKWRPVLARHADESLDPEWMERVFRTVTSALQPAADAAQED
jgi:hypothetical protein